MSATGTHIHRTIARRYLAHTCRKHTTLVWCLQHLAKYYNLALATHKYKHSKELGHNHNYLARKHTNRREMQYIEYLETNATTKRRDNKSSRTCNWCFGRSPCMCVCIVETLALSRIATMHTVDMIGLPKTTCRHKLQQALKIL